MKHKVRKAVSHSISYKIMVVNEIVSGGLSIASACIQYKIDEVYMVRERVARIYSKLLVVKIMKIGLDT